MRNVRNYNYVYLLENTGQKRHFQNFVGTIDSNMGRTGYLHTVQNICYVFSRPSSELLSFLDASL